MKKRRVLALLLALSLAVSMNGMTALAAGTGDMQMAELSLEDESEAREDGGQGNDPVEETVPTDNVDEEDSEAKTDDKELDPGSEQTPEDSGDSDESGNPNDDKKDDDSDVEDGSETDEQPDADTDLEDNKDGMVEEEPDAEETLTEEKTEETEKQEPAEEEKKPEEEAIVRTVNFTDDTGMRITYDTYIIYDEQTKQTRTTDGFNYEVENGVLVSLTKGDNKETVTGNVVLSQPGEGADYERFTSIAAYVFQGNDKITYVKIPAGVTTIEDNTFKGCTALKGCYIPSKVTSIGSSAFEGCTSLTQLAIPKSVASIGTKAFYGDAKLFMVHMKDVDYSQLADIGESAFEGCSALQKFCSDGEFNFPESITSVGARAFYGCSKIPKVIMGAGVTSIGTEAFMNCTSMEELSISRGCGIISQYAFAGCSNLQTVTFVNSNNRTKTTIESYAFKNCTSLGSIDIQSWIEQINSYAFSGCSRLGKIRIRYDDAVLQTDAFPNSNPNICLVGAAGSTASEYASKAKIRFVDPEDVESKQYYTYTTKVSGPGTDTDKPISIVVSNKRDGGASDINALNGGKGVEAGTELYVYILYYDNKNIQLVPKSLKCNGTVIEAKDRIYTFTMPVGGAVISAEFENINSSVAIKGFEDNVSTELSNGDELKIGQTTKLFLTSDYPGDDNLIPASKIEYSISPYSSKSVASVASDGTIKALAVGTTVICAKVKRDGNGNSFTKTVTIRVSAADVDSIKIRATEYDKSVIALSESADGVQSASIDSDRVTKAYAFKLKATAYDEEEDNMAVAFKWTSSDIKVAKLSAASTTSASSINTVTIPANTDGEATITVTATNADKTTVTQKFIISVKNYKPRLSESTITINPNQKEGTVLEIISAYGEGINKESIALYAEKVDLDYKDFKLEYDAANSTDTVARFIVTASDGLADGTYNRRLKVDVMNSTYKIPVKLVVKKTAPNPKVGFVAKQPKLNLFYKNDGTEFNMTVSNLGKDQVSSYTLESLTSSDDDKLFTENFQVEKVDGSHCRITQKSSELKYTSKKKPAVTGYLVLKFEGYKSSIVKKYKITIPTQTVSPSYALSRTSDTYYAGCAQQDIELQLLDKKNKNAVVDLNDGFTVRVKAVEGATRAVTSCSAETNDEGESIIQLPMTQNPAAGKVYLEVTNDAWANNKTFTYIYTIKTSSSTPKISLTSTTVTLNQSYPEQIVTFGLKSNQTDTVISDEQEFLPNVNDRTKASLKEQYAKLDVTYENGVGTVTINDSTIANGTYRFICDAAEYEYRGRKQGANKLTLNVRVAKGVPSVTAKGTVAFNTLATKSNQDGSYSYVEKSELVFTKKNLPDDYEYDVDAMKKSITCNTKGCSGYEKRFEWNIDSDNNKLVVSMKEWCPNKTYSFSITPTFVNSSTGNVVAAKKLNFNVKVYSGNIKVSLSAKGKLNLLDRSGECTTANSIMYMPKFTNLKDQVVEAAVYDANGVMPEYDPDNVSKLFTVNVSTDGMLYVTPKQGAELENNKTYKIMIWMKLRDYQAFEDYDGNGTWSNVLSVKTAQSLPKVTTDKNTVNLYLSNKSYETSFIVDKQEVKSVKPVGRVTSIAFDEKDAKAKESFDIKSQQLSDGSLKVTLKLKNTVSYSNNTTNKIKMYVEFEGQGTNTAGTQIIMNVKINK